MNLTEEITDYFQKRGLVVPTAMEALAWVNTELGEVYEVVMSWDDKWVRNNPKDHPVKSKEDFAEELGDVILMLVMAGLAEGVDPVQALQKKMREKLKKIAVVTSAMQEVSESDVEDF